MSKSCGHLSKGVFAALREEVRPSKVGGYELVLKAAERWSRVSAPILAKPRWESIGKLFNPIPFVLEMEGARQR